MQRGTLLDGLGSVLDPPRAEPGGKVRHELQRAIIAAGSPPSPSEPRRQTGAARGRRRLVLVVALVVALTATGLVVQTARIAGRPPASTASAAEILDRAGLAAEREPELVARPDQFVFTEATVDEPGGQPETRRLRRWLSVDGTHDGLSRWRPEAQPSAWHDQAEPASGAPAYRTDLPTDRDGMLHYLYAQRPKNCDGVGNCMPYDPSLADLVAFSTALKLLLAYIPPRTRATLFQATAQIRGTTVVHDAVDASGRRGVAVRQSIEGSWFDLIFDPNTFRYLGSRTSMGTQLGRTATGRVAIVDHPGQLP